MINLKPNEVCPYSAACRYNEGCRGSDEKRSNHFSCDLVSDGGVFSEGKFRSKFDETGRMRVISE